MVPFLNTLVPVRGWAVILFALSGPVCLFLGYIMARSEKRDEEVIPGRWGCGGVRCLCMCLANHNGAICQIDTPVTSRGGVPMCLPCARAWDEQ